MFCKQFRISLIEGLFLLFVASSVLAEGEIPQGQIKEQPTYENEALGVKITVPEGWYIISGEKIQEILYSAIIDSTPVPEKERIKKKAESTLVVFSQYPLSSPGDNPGIELYTEPLKPAYKTTMDYANAEIQSMEAAFKDFKIIKEPTLVLLDSQEGVKFMFEASMVNRPSLIVRGGDEEKSIRILYYIFIKNDRVCHLFCRDTADNFDNNAGRFETTVNSLVLK